MQRGRKYSSAPEGYLRYNGAADPNSDPGVFGILIGAVVDLRRRAKRQGLAVERFGVICPRILAGNSRQVGFLYTYTEIHGQGPFCNGMHQGENWAHSTMAVLKTRDAYSRLYVALFPISAPDSYDEPLEYLHMTTELQQIRTDRYPSGRPDPIVDTTRQDRDTARYVRSELDLQRIFQTWGKLISQEISAPDAYQRLLLPPAQ